MSLHYTEQMSYEQDAYLGREMIARIEQVIEETPGADMVELPVIIIGNRPFQGNNATLTGEIIGSSFFDYDVNVEPVYYWSSRRILGFLHTLGADYSLPSKEGLATAKILARDMPVWPAEGSVQVQENMVIIKLSD